MFFYNLIHRISNYQRKCALAQSDVQDILEGSNRFFIRVFA